MKGERECLYCKKDKLNGYRCCEDHIGRYLKREQDQKARDAEWFSDYDNACGDGREFGY